MKRKMWSMCALVLVLMMLVSFPGITGAALGIKETDTIVQATGTSGSRTNGNYYVCAHTANRRNETLQSFLGSGQSNLRLLTVSGSYY